MPVADLVAEARRIAAAGQKEIVLTGVNTGDFGRTTGERFIDLLRALNEVEGIERYRISSIEPNLLTDEIIAFCATSPKFMHHFHIPLQSGSDRILGLMRRRYTTARFAERIAAVRRLMPDAFIGIDVIVGFPGETEDDFRTTGGELCAIDEEGMSARATQAQEELTYAGYYSTSMFPPVELLYVTGTENDAVASALQNMWSTTLGVNVMLRGVTQAEYNTRMEAGNYELALQKVTALYDDAMGFLDRWCSEDEQNLISYENGTYDVLMGVARASENPVARTAFLHDAETMLLGETALSPVYFDGTAHMLRDTLRGVYTDGFGNSYFAGVRANTD